MRFSRSILASTLVLLAALSAQAGVEIVMHSKIDIPGVKMKIMGKDFSQSEQRFLVDDDAMLKGTVIGGTTNWIDLEREAFFDQTKRKCTVTTFVEMEEQLEALSGQGSPLSFMGGGGDDRPERDPQEYDVRFDTHAGQPATVAGLTGKSSVIEIEVIEKKSGDVVSKIEISNVHVDSDELRLLQEFDRKLAERQVKSMGAALGMDFDTMRGKIMDRPEMRKALKELQAAGIGENQAVVRTMTRITSTQPPPQVNTDVEGEAEPETEEAAPSGFAARMMAKMKARQKRDQTTEATTPVEPGQPQTMSFSSELISFEKGVDVTLPQQCVEAYKKKKK